MHIKKWKMPINILIHKEWPQSSQTNYFFILFQMLAICGMTFSTVGWFLFKGHYPLGWISPRVNIPQGGYHQGWSTTSVGPGQIFYMFFFLFFFPLKFQVSKMCGRNCAKNTLKVHLLKVKRCQKVRKYSKKLWNF